MERTLDQIRDYVSAGCTIKWVGYHSPMRVYVHLYRQDTVLRFVVPLQKDYSESDFRHILSMSASNPGSNTGTIWSSDSRLELLRLASILGLNIGGSCLPGSGQQFKSKMGCIMAYDIESDRSRIPLSSFGSLSESITSIATYCTCGDKQVFSFIPNVDFDYILCKNSRDVVSKFLRHVELHSPQWALGYNNFGYDNTRIAYHSDPEFDNILIPMRIGSGSSLTYAFYIDVEGVYNVDLMAYLDKTRRAMYPNMALASLVAFHEIEHKMEFDTSNVTDFAELFRYNLHDCKITAELALKTGALTEMAFLCSAACVPVIDSARFVTGTFAACSIASYCLKNRISMDWSQCGYFQEYRGAEVLKPVIGLHEDVVSCDFSSMYPTILLGANISIENFVYGDTTASEGSAWLSNGTSNFVIQGKLVSFDRHAKTIVPPVMRGFVETRKLVKKTDPAYAMALKVAANSIYGSLGDKNSRIYSPMCSAAVTTGGRWCLSLAQSIIRAYGFMVVYGDTDSCYVKRTSKAKCKIEDVMKIMKTIFLFTPFPGMSMEIEDRFSKIVFLGKKTYFGRSVTGKTISKGMSKSRKDRLGVCRTLSANVVDTVLSDLSKESAKTIIADMISYAIDSTVTRRLLLSDVSKYVKKGGSNYFEYKAEDGSRHSLECESHTGHEIVFYSSDVVCGLIVRELKAILDVSAMGSIRDILRYSSNI